MSFDFFEALFFCKIVSNNLCAFLYTNIFLKVASHQSNPRAFTSKSVMLSSLLNLRKEFQQIFNGFIGNAKQGMRKYTQQKGKNS